jgi:hypothetical protein
MAALMKNHPFLTDDDDDDGDDDDCFMFVGTRGVS